MEEKSPPPLNTNNIVVTTKQQQELQELQQLWKELGMTSSSLSSSPSSVLRPHKTDDDGRNVPTVVAANTNANIITGSNMWQNPILTIGFGTAVLFNIGILCSLPPVLRGRGAPYLPTYEKNIRQMFQQLRNETRFMKQYHQVVAAAAHRTVNHSTTKLQLQQQQLIFVDLGSGDGRIVFHAAYNEQLFTHCIGYEINIFLHTLALLKQQWWNLKIFMNTMIGYPTMQTNRNAMVTATSVPSSLSSSSQTTSKASMIGPIQTQFYLRDLWKVNLQNVNVVAVYGLGPIMKELGEKLRNELPHGSYVLSNVFTFPGWKPLPTSNNHGNDNITTTRATTYIYRIPDCYDGTL